MYLFMFSQVCVIFLFGFEINDFPQNSSSLRPLKTTRQKHQAKTRVFEFDDLPQKKHP